jgi:lipoprotein NlpI
MGNRFDPPLPSLLSFIRNKGRKVIAMRKMDRKAIDFFEEGQIHMRMGDYETSIEDFTDAMKAGWDLKVSHLSRGVANLLAKHPDKAYDDFTEVLMLDGLNARAFYYRGLTSMMRGRFARAAGDFTRALEVEPDYGLAALNRGVCKARTGRHKEAVEDIKLAMMIAETDSQRFADHMGIWRNHLEGVLGVLHGHTDLTDEDIEKLKGFFE